MARKSVVVWQDPPARRWGMRRGDYVDHHLVAETLKSNPDAWAKVGKYRTVNSSASVASHIRGGLLAAYAPAGTFEAVARTVDGEYWVYARYIGEGNDH